MRKDIVVYSVFVALGLIGGYVYYAKVGCLSGTCPITSSPTATTIYGGLLGYLVAGFFVKEKKNG